jgi:hypothetical protein
MADRINNKGNWFFVEIIERMERANANEKNPLRRCTVWGNYHLIKAQTPEEAYAKAEAIGKEGSYSFRNVDKVEMKWEYVGIGNLLPIYEDIEDGAEIMWADYGFISAKRSKRFALTKKQLLKGIKLKKK